MSNKLRDAFNRALDITEDDLFFKCPCGWIGYSSELVLHQVNEHDDCNEYSCPKCKSYISEDMEIERDEFNKSLRESIGNEWVEGDCKECEKWSAHTKDGLCSMHYDQREYHKYHAKEDRGECERCEGFGMGLARSNGRPSFGVIEGGKCMACEGTGKRSTPSPALAKAVERGCEISWRRAFKAFWENKGMPGNISKNAKEDAEQALKGEGDI